jgi:multisubunit Na+/H+ antiporter MnhG subunit
MRVLDNFSDLLNDRIMRPLSLVGRTIGYGFVLIVVGLTTLFVALIFVMRFLDIYAFAGHQWITFAIVGTLMVLFGLWVWRLRRPSRLRK